MKNLGDYNKFVQSLESRTNNGLFFHRINDQIYITDFTHKLLGIWELNPGKPLLYKDILKKNANSSLPS